MRTWTPTGYRFSAAVFWLLWLALAGLVGLGGAALIGGQAGPTMAIAYGAGAAGLLGFGAIFARYVEDPRWFWAASLAGLALAGYAVWRSGAGTEGIIALAAAVVATAVFAPLLRFRRGARLSALALALVAVGLGAAMTLSLRAQSGTEIAASTPQPPEAAAPPPAAEPEQPASEQPAPPPPPSPSPAAPAAPAPAAPAPTPATPEPAPGATAGRVEAEKKVSTLNKPSRIIVGSRAPASSDEPAPVAESRAETPVAAPPPPMPEPQIGAGGVIGGMTGAPRKLETVTAAPPSPVDSEPVAGGAPPTPAAPVQVGTFAVNKPERMSVLKSVQIEVEIGVAGETAPTDLGSGGPITSRAIEVTRKMDVQLVSNDFDVAPDGQNGALLVLPGKPARWAWQVKARTAGPGKVIKVYVYSVDGADRALIKRHEETIEVTVTPIERATLVARWSKDNWEPLASLAGGIAAAIGFVMGLLGIRRKKPEAA